MFKKIIKTSTKLAKKSSSINKTQTIAVFNLNSVKRNYASEKKNAAVLLSGCGYLDGSEVTETVSCIIQLQKAGYTVDCFAPSATQEKTYDHVTQVLEKNEVRNVASESTRIARKLQQWKKLKPDSYNLLVVPGGFGVGSNLSTYADDGVENFTVDKEVESVLRAFHEKKTPMALVCIAPILAAKIFGTANGGPGCKITLGNDPELSSKVEKLGVTVEKKTIYDVCIDAENNIVSTPAYMDSKADPLTVFESVGKMISSVSQLRGIAETAGLSPEVIKAINGLVDDKDSSEHKKWWVEQLQKGDDFSASEQSYKATFNNPDNWKPKDF